LGRTGKNWDDIRRACYRAARERLLDAGYTQISMRMFRAAHAPDQDGPVYCCQEDGMVGLGCGARSYTRTRHYSSEYAVGASGVRAILADYIARPDKDFDLATYGFVLNPDEQRRRYLIQSLLQHDGLSLAAYARRFGSDPFHDLPSLDELIEQGLAVCSSGVLQLTAEGLEYSDAIGPWLYSPEVCRLMAEYELR
jgi:oxygen-independent coproporphyrinogen-3 oxidase